MDHRIFGDRIVPMEFSPPSTYQHRGKPDTSAAPHPPSPQCGEDPLLDDDVIVENPLPWITPFSVVHDNHGVQSREDPQVLAPVATSHDRLGGHIIHFVALNPPVVGEACRVGRATQSTFGQRQMALLTDSAIHLPETARLPFHMPLSSTSWPILARS